MLLTGKLNRGLSVIDSYRLLRQGMGISTDEVFLGCVLGWCIEWVHPEALLINNFLQSNASVARMFIVQVVFTFLLL